MVDALAERGFPEPAMFMSGNGYHALYTIDLPVEDKALVRDFLKALDHKFSDDVGPSERKTPIDTLIEWMEGMAV